MPQDVIETRPVIEDVRTFTEASAIKEMLRRSGVPASEVHLRVCGLRFVSPIDGLVALAAFGLVAFATAPIAGLVCMLLPASTLSTAVGVTAYLVALAALCWWVEHRRARRHGVGYAIPDRVEITVSKPYAENAARILATTDGRLP